MIIGHSSLVMIWEGPSLPLLILFKDTQRLVILSGARGTRA